MNWTWNISYSELMMIGGVALIFLGMIWWCQCKRKNERETYEMIYRDMVIPMGDIDIRDKEEDEVYY
jgi:hypothetical protein